MMFSFPTVLLLKESNRIYKGVIKGLIKGLKFGLSFALMQV
jgi:hypothetical protein